MTHTYRYYLKNIFINPVKAADGILSAPNLKTIAILSFLIGSLGYVFIVLMSYNALGWNDFPYKEYYPHYFSPYWWEVFVVPVWGLVIALGFAIPCYFVGKLFRGKGTFPQVITFVLLASIVSLPIMVSADIVRIIYNPDWVIGFAKHGHNFVPSYPNEIVRIIEVTYFYVAMTWQGIVTIIGLAVIHRIQWYKNILGIVLGMGIFFGFLLAIRDYVALII